MIETFVGTLQIGFTILAALTAGFIVAAVGAAMLGAFLAAMFLIADRIGKAWETRPGTPEPETRLASEGHGFGERAEGVVPFTRKGD